jgi:hypothetical protein
MYQHQFGANFVAMADGTVTKATYNVAYRQYGYDRPSEVVLQLYMHMALKY